VRQLCVIPYVNFVRMSICFVPSSTSAAMADNNSHILRVTCMLQTNYCHIFLMKFMSEKLEKRDGYVVIDQ